MTPGKYLPALRCLVAAQKLDAERAEIKGLIARFQSTLGELEERLPKAATDVIDSILRQLDV